MMDELTGASQELILITSATACSERFIDTLHGRFNYSTGKFLTAPSRNRKGGGKECIEDNENKLLDQL